MGAGEAGTTRGDQQVSYINLDARTWDGVLEEVSQERERQDTKWGEQNHPDGTGGRHAMVMANTLRIACDNADERGVKARAAFGRVAS